MFYKHFYFKSRSGLSALLNCT